VQQLAGGDPPRGADACFQLSLLNVKDLLFERGIDICRDTVRMWWNRLVLSN
jgi:transposase-like protein